MRENNAQSLPKDATGPSELRHPHTTTGLRNRALLGTLAYTFARSGRRRQLLQPCAVRAQTRQRGPCVDSPETLLHAPRQRSQWTHETAEAAFTAAARGEMRSDS
jgi:hypothetical protein